MKLKTLLTTLAAAVGLTTAAQAATPVATWTDFNNPTSGDYTLTIDDSCIIGTDGSVVIGANGGLKLELASDDPIATGNAVTIVAEVENIIATGDKRTVFSIKTGSNYANLTKNGDGTIYSKANDSTGYGNIGNYGTIGKAKLAYAYGGSSGTDAWVESQKKASNGSLKWSTTNISAIYIGSYDGTTQVMQGLKIKKLEIYASKLTEKTDICGTSHPAVWFKYNGNYDAMGTGSFNVNGENAGNYSPSISGQALKITDGATHPYGSNWSYGSGAWAVTTFVKPIANASNKIVIWTTGVKGGWFGLVTDSANNKAILAAGNGSGISTTICEATVENITDFFHLYTVRCDGSGNFELIVDGDLDGKATGTYTTTLPTSNYQIGAVNQGCPSGLARTTGTLIDDLRVYQRAFADAEVTALAKDLLAPETISINIGGGRSNGAAASDHLVQTTECTGLAAVPGAGWNNIAYQWSSGTSKEIAAGSVKVTDGTKLITRKDVTVYTSAKNTYDGGSARVNAFHKGYLDDGSYNSHKAYVKVSSIPYSKYDLIVYTATDSSGNKFGAVNVNGTQYTYDGATKQGTASWGDSDATATEYGKNAIIVQGLSYGDLEVEGTTGSSVRGGIAAIQIVNRGTISEKHEYTKTMAQSCNFSDLFDEEEFVPGTLTYVTVNVTATEPVTLTMDDPTVTLAKLTISSSVNFKLQSTAEMNKVGTVDLSGVTGKITLGTGCVNFSPASVPSAGIRFEGTTALATIPWVATSFKNATVEIACSVTSVGNGGSFVGDKRYVFDEGFAIEDTKFSIGNSGNTSQYFEQKGGTVTLTDSADAKSNNGPMLLGHWPGADRKYTLSGGTLNALNGVIRLGWDGACALTVGGSEGAALLKTKGIRGGTDGRVNSGSSLTVKAGGTVYLGANGIYFGTSDFPLTLNGGKIASYGNATVTAVAGVTLTAASTVAADAGQKLTFASAISGDYALTVGSATETGTVIFDGATPANVIVNGGVAVFADRTKVPTVNAGTVGYIVTLNDLGSFTVPEGVDASTVKLYNDAGIEQTITKVEGQVITFEQNLYGNNCLMEYLFNKTLDSTGSDTGALQFDGTHCFPGKEYVMEVKTNIVEEQEVVTTNYVGIYAASAPWRNVSFPSEVTVVMYGKVMKTDNTCQIGIGSTTGGSKYSLFLASGSVSAEEVKLCYAYNNNNSGDKKVEASGELCTMSVPHAQTTDHLYAFTLKKSGDDTIVNIYLDGEVLQPYTFKNQTVTLGSGIQLGSIHGGIGNDQNWPDAFGFKRSTAVETDATLQFLRVYNVVLNDTVMRKIAKDYPYASPAGSFSRDLTGDCNWVETAAWTKAKDENKYDVPDNGSAVTLTPPASDVNLTVNIDTDAAYETLTVNQGGKVIFKTDAEKSGIVNVSGKTTISTDVALDYDAIRANGAVSIATGKKVDIDLTSIDLKNYWVDTAVKVTGPIVVGTIDQITVKTAADAEGRTCTFRFNEDTKQTELDVKVPTADIVGTLDADGNITWTWGEGNTLSTTPDWLKVKATLVVPNGVAWTYDLGNMAITNVVVDGTATIGTTRGKTFSGSGKINVTLTDAEYGATEAQALFTVADGASVEVGTVTYKDVDVTESCDIQGGSVTVTTKVPYTYNNGWTWNGSAIDAQVVSNNTGVAIIVKSDLEWNIDRSTFTVEAGTLKATKAGTATITVNGGAFDVNGLGGSLYTVILNGGSLVNNGAKIGDTKQVTAITLTKDSTVGGTGDFSVQGTAAGQYERTSMDLGEYTLTKTGDNTFALVNTDIDGTGTLYVEKGNLYSSENTFFTNGVLKIGAKGAVLNRGDKTLTVTKIVGVEGALIWGNYNGEGTFSDFTLEGTVTLKGGNYGTITMTEGAVLNTGNKRNLTLAGTGTVNVVLTDDEIAAQGGTITVFTTESGNIAIGTVLDKDGNDVSSKCKISGGKITVKAGLLFLIK